MGEYDVAVIGAGPAGLMAAVYAARYGLKTIVFGEIFGGTINEAPNVCNFPTYKEIRGYELSQKMLEQATSLGVIIIPKKVEKISKKGNEFIIAEEEKRIQARKVIIAVGRKRKQLGIPREKEFKGKGISYCAVCDGPLFNDKIVGVIGGGDAGISSAIHLADFAKKVFIIYRREKFFKAEEAWVKLAEKNPKIENIFNSNVAELIGGQKLEGVVLDNEKKLALDWIFVEIGSEPEAEVLKQMGVKLDENGYIVVDSKMRTSMHGIFSAGDLNSGNFKQAVVAVAEGAIAANSAYGEIKQESMGEN